MRNFWVIAVLLASAPALAALEAGRSLPLGEHHYLVVAEIYHSPQGEVQLLESEAKEATAFLRRESGELCTLEQMSGSAACDDWFFTAKADAPPTGCELIFTGGDDCRQRVRSEDLRAATLFQAVSKVIKRAR